MRQRGHTPRFRDLGRWRHRGGGVELIRIHRVDGSEDKLLSDAAQRGGEFHIPDGFEHDHVLADDLMRELVESKRGFHGFDTLVPGLAHGAGEVCSQRVGGVVVERRTVGEDHDDETGVLCVFGEDIDHLVEVFAVVVVADFARV